MRGGVIVVVCYSGKKWAGREISDLNRDGSSRKNLETLDHDLRATPAIGSFRSDAIIMVFTWTSWLIKDYKDGFNDFERLLTDTTVWFWPPTLGYFA